MITFNRSRYVICISIAAVAAALMVVGLVLNHSLFEKNYIAAFQTDQLALADTVARGVEGKVDDIQDDLQHLAGTWSVLKERGDLEVELGRYLEQHSHVLNSIAIADAKGDITYQKPKTDDKWSIADSAGLRTVWRNRRLYIGELAACANHSGKLHVGVIAPVFDKGQIRRVIFACLNLEMLVNFIPQPTDGIQSNRWLVNTNGRLLHHINPEYVGLTWGQIKDRWRSAAIDAGQEIDENIENHESVFRQRVQDGERGTAEYLNALTGIEELVAFTPIILDNSRYGLAVTAAESLVCGPRHIHTRVMFFVIAGTLILLTIAIFVLVGHIRVHAKFLSEQEQAAQRQQVLQDLEESENKYRTLFESCPDGILVADRQTKQFRYANPTVYKMFGYSRTELEVMAVEDIVPKKDLPRVIAAFEAQVRGDIPLATDIPLVRKDGTVFCADINSVPVVMEGKPYLIGFFRDVTERKRAEEEIRKFSTISDRAAHGNAIADIQGNITYINDYFARIHGYTPDELVGQNLSLLHTEKQMVSVRKINESLIEEGRYDSIEVWHAHKDGTEFPMLMSGIMIQDESGKPKYMSATAIDITGRKRVEQALQESEEKYRAIFEQAADMIVLLDVQTGTLLEFNTKAHENLGYSREEFQKLKIADFEVIESAEEIIEHTARIAREGSDTFETKHRTKDGQIREMLIGAKSISIAERVLCLAVWRDVTEEKQAEDDIRQYEERLRSLAVELSLAEDQERRQLASELHDGPGQLLSLAKIKLSTLDKRMLPAECKESLAAVEQLVTRAEQSTSSLTFQIYNPALHDLGFEPAVEWLAENIQESYGLKVDLADDGQHKPMDEPLRVVMFQCLREVLVNAAKHAKVDRVRVNIGRQGKFVRVTVSDDGVGFDSRTSFPTNHGFGLFSIRERISQLGGHVEIKSAPGQGATVTLEAPISSETRKTTRRES